VNKQSWHCLELEVPRALADDLSTLCFEMDSCGLEIEERDALVCLRAYFAAECSMADVHKTIAGFLADNDLGQIAFGDSQVEEEDWEAEWRQFFRPVWATPHIVVHPSWIPVDPGEGIAVVIDPKMAFGTGGHESTQLCLQALERYMRSGCKCLDLGTGSGILSIVAAKLGAASILALDIDAASIENAIENIERNGIDAALVDLRVGSVDSIGTEHRFDLVLANIQRHILEPMLADLYALLAPGGLIIFSGLLVKERDRFCAAIERQGLQVEDVLTKNEWICSIARRVD
jgi:ribosomal protein L11 methyltransferase